MRFRSNSAVKFTRKRVGKAKDGRTVSAVTCILGTSKLKELNLRAGLFFFFFDVVHRITMQSPLLWLLTVSVFLLILMSLTAPAARKKTGSSECVRSMYYTTCQANVKTPCLDKIKPNNAAGFQKCQKNFSKCVDDCKRPKKYV